MQHPSAPPLGPAMDVQLSSFSSHMYDNMHAEIKAPSPAAQDATQPRIDGPTQNPRCADGPPPVSATHSTAIQS